MNSRVSGQCLYTIIINQVSRFVIILIANVYINIAKDGKCIQYVP